MLNDGYRGTGAPGHRRWSVLAITAWSLVAACASTGDPPGGPPDTKAPVVVTVLPESGSVLTTPPNEVSITFDEVIAERVAGTPPEITGAVLLSPADGEVRVGWHRDHITVRPRAGFVAGRIYRLELLPVVTDLRTNRLKTGQTIVFSTGPAIPEAAVEGSVVDWVGGHAAVRALIEATLMPDSLTYRTLADSTGYFRMAQIPAGRYLVRGVMDTNNDRRFGTREAYDSVTVRLDSSSSVELFAFAHDTVGPRLRQIEVTDSMTLKLTFDRPLDPTVTLDSSMVSVVTLDDSTTHLEIMGVYTPKALEALTRHLADSVAAAKAHADSIAAASDTTRRRPPADSGRAARPAGRQAGAQPAGVGVRSAVGGRPPLDSTRAERMVARRPAPTDVAIVKLAAPFIPDVRYVVYVTGARSLSGNVRDSRNQVRAPKPPPARSRPATDSAAADSTRLRLDSVRPAAPPVRP